MLEVEAGGIDVEDLLTRTIAEAEIAGARAIVLGCAGMSRLRVPLAARTEAVLIDGVMASAHLARALATLTPRAA